MDRLMTNLRPLLPIVAVVVLGGIAHAGEFSLGISGFVVEGGVRGAPIREMTVAGTLLDLLGAVEAVGDDLRFTFGPGFVGAPSLLVRSLPVSGA